MQCKFILVVEDDFDIRENLKEFLILEGYEAVAVQNGREALNFLAESQKLPGVILLDLMMPIMTGAEFLIRLGQELPGVAANVPVIVLSAAGDSLRSKVVATTCIRKPIDLDELLSVIEKHCGLPGSKT